MSDPQPENVEFYVANKESIDERIEDANKQRILQGFPVLSQAEMDDGVTAMRQLVEEGGRVTQFRFPPPTQAPARRDPPSTRSASSPPAHGEIGSSRKSFAVIKCENGYVLHIQDDQPQTFIFESARKLVGILKTLLFEEKKYERKKGKKTPEARGQVPSGDTGVSGNKMAERASDNPADGVAAGVPRLKTGVGPA